MGIISHNDLFFKKGLTAIIRDSQDRGYFVHIKKTLDDYFVTMLNNTFYAFSLEGARIITHRYFAMKSFQWIDYDTTHYKSMQMDKLEELKLCLIKNQLPRMNMFQYYMHKLLGRKERKKLIQEQTDAKAAISSQLAAKNLTVDELNKDNVKEINVPPHQINALIQELEERQNDFPEESTNLINYIKSLDIDHIVTPVLPIGNYIEDDLIATKPSFIGELMPRLTRVLGKHSTITNSPYSTKNAWMMKLMILSFVVVGIVMVFWMVDQGFFDQILSMFPSADSFAGAQSAFQPSAANAPVDQCSEAALQKRYPEPIQLKLALDSGAETCELPENIKQWVKDAKVPTAAPVTP